MTGSAFSRILVPTTFSSGSGHARSVAERPVSAVGAAQASRRCA